MSATLELEEQVRATLAAHPPITETLTGIFAAPPVRAAMPYAVIGETPSIDWSVKDREGREARLAVLLFDQAEFPERLQRIASEAEAAMAALPQALPGWRIATCQFLRSRMLPAGAGKWTAQIEYRVRMFRADSA